MNKRTRLLALRLERMEPVGILCATFGLAYCHKSKNSGSFFDGEFGKV